MVLLLLIASLDISLIRNLQQNHGMYREQSQLLEEEEALAQLRAFELPQDAFASLTGQKKKKSSVMEKVYDRKSSEPMEDEGAEDQDKIKGNADPEDENGKQEDAEGYDEDLRDEGINEGLKDKDADPEDEDEDQIDEDKDLEDEDGSDEGDKLEGKQAQDEGDKPEGKQVQDEGNKLEGNQVQDEDKKVQNEDDQQIGKVVQDEDKNVQNEDDQQIGKVVHDEGNKQKDEEDADVSWNFSFGFYLDLNKQRRMIENILAYLFCQSLDTDDLEQWREREQDAAPQLYEAYTDYVQSLLADAVYFPIPEASNDAQATVSYENSWQSERTYGGTRGHEGCDLMASVQQRGYYPVVSVSDGVVEKIGWLPQGGYRIGIRSRHGVYYYYAHLAEYEDGMEEGVSVAAGQLIGYMGDTGYSEVEGTTGNFPVHLHFGMYLDLEGRGEVSFNPYYLLGLLEKNKLRYTYPK